MLAAFSGRSGASKNEEKRASTNKAGKTIAVLAALSALVTGPAHAAGAGAPWEAPLQAFLNSLTGPVAQIVGVAAVVLCGFAIAFSEGGGGLRKLVFVALGLSIAFAATTFFLPLFGFAGGVAF
jgi:type IV secretion system protein VirB2